MADEKELNPSPKFPEGEYPELSPNPKFENGLVDKTSEQPNGSEQTNPQVKPTVLNGVVHINGKLYINGVLVSPEGATDLNAIQQAIDDGVLDLRSVYTVEGDYQDITAAQVKAIVDGHYTFVKFLGDEEIFGIVCFKQVGGTGVYFLNVLCDIGGNGVYTLIQYQVSTDNVLTTTTKVVNPNYSLQLAPAYDSTSTYAVGDLVSYGGVLYRCKTAISTAEEWNSSHWETTTIASEVLGLINTGV